MTKEETMNQAENQIMGQFRVVCNYTLDLGDRPLPLVSHSCFLQQHVEQTLHEARSLQARFHRSG